MFFDSFTPPFINRYICRARNIFVFFGFLLLNFPNSLSVDLFINSFINLFISPPINSSTGLIFNIFIYSSLINSAVIIFINFKKFPSRFFFSRFFLIFFK